MLLIECDKMKKYYGDRLILDVDHLSIYSEDRIGIVGANGAGKTTLVDILSNRLKPDEGTVRRYGDFAYIAQLDPPDRMVISGELASRFGVEPVWKEGMSGGEKTRFKLAEAFDRQSVLIFADEPTSHVDMEGIALLGDKFESYPGALVVISHDRSFLDRVCNQILEIEDGRVKSYPGNYTAYHEQKLMERERARFEFEAYDKEKKRLEDVMKETKERVTGLRKAPKRMGNSEARLHKMGPQKAQASLGSAVKNIEKRIEHLEVKERPKGQPRMHLDVMDAQRLHSKVLIEGIHLDKAFGDRVIFKDAQFRIPNGAKVALIGPNGSGKSTLIRMIMEREEGIRVALGVKIGYFSQDMDMLDENSTILQDVMESSIHPENTVRLLLARLLFKGDDVYKRISMLSGGERVRVSFAKILLQDINLLILDEPANYMDIPALEVIEETLRDYDRTLLVVSHDRQFVDAVADHILTIEDRKLKLSEGNYTEQLQRKDRQVPSDLQDQAQQVMVLKNRLSEVLGRLSLPVKKDVKEELDRRYEEILAELKRIGET